jgi:hypothetical protein
MKTYTLNREYKNYSVKVEIVPDPKREGMQKTTVSYSTDGYKRKFSGLYGKKNQPEILKLIEEAISLGQ